MSFLALLNKATNKVDEDKKNQPVEILNTTSSFQTSSSLDESEWLENNKSVAAPVYKGPSTFPTKIFTIDSCKLIWAKYKNYYYPGRICDINDANGQRGCDPNPGEHVVVELFHKVKEGEQDKNRLIIAEEKDIFSYNGNKRNMNRPIDHKDGFAHDFSGKSWHVKKMDKLHEVWTYSL